MCYLLSRAPNGSPSSIAIVMIRGRKQHQPEAHPHIHIRTYIDERSIGYDLAFNDLQIEEAAAAVEYDAMARRCI